MKTITIKIGEVEQKLLNTAIKAELVVFDKMVAMLLRQEQPEATKPLLIQIKTLLKLQKQIDGEKVE